MQTEIMKAFRFDEADLAANKSGTHSRKQAEAYSTSGNRGCQGVVGVMGLLALVGAGLLTLSALRSARVGAEIAMWIGVGLLVIGAVFMIRYFFKSVDHSVQMTQGTAQISSTTRGPSAKADGQSTDVLHQELIINGISFSISPQSLKVLKEGDTYVVYYTKDTQRILSLEHISGGTKPLQVRS